MRGEREAEMTSCEPACPKGTLPITVLIIRVIELAVLDFLPRETLELKLFSRTLLLDLGFSLVVPRDFFQMIQQWVPSLNNDVLN